MSLWSCIANVLRGDRLNRDIDEEFASHLEEAAAAGRDPHEARRAFGFPLRNREESRDARMLVWLDSLRADTVFGLRHLEKEGRFRRRRSFARPRDRGLHLRVPVDRRLIAEASAGGEPAATLRDRTPWHWI